MSKYFPVKSDPESLLPSCELFFERFPTRSARALISRDDVFRTQRFVHLIRQTHGLQSVGFERFVEIIQRQLRQRVLPVLLALRDQRSDDVMRGPKGNAFR